MTMMERRSIRAWHYTRMADDEIVGLLEVGIHLSTPGTIRSRIDTQIERGTIARPIGGPCEFWMPRGSPETQFSNLGPTSTMPPYDGRFTS